MIDKLDDALYYLFTVAVGGVIYLVKRVFTNQQQIELLKREIQERDRQRTESNAVIALSLKKLEEDVTEVKEEVRYLRRNQS